MGFRTKDEVIDLIIEILRGSRSQKQAKACLMEGNTEGIHFKTKSSERKAKALCFTERQATAILEMRLYKLIGLEIDALLEEHQKTVANIDRYEDILNNYDSMAAVIREDLEAVRREYAMPRRTVIENAAEAVFEEKKLEEIEVCVLMDRFGYVRTVDRAVYERNQEAADAESRYHFFCKNTDKLCLFTEKGTMYQARVSDLPYGKFRDKGIPIDNFCNYSSTEEQILHIDAMENLRWQSLLFVTTSGMCKQVPGNEFTINKRTSAA